MEGVQDPGVDLAKKKEVGLERMKAEKDLIFGSFHAEHGKYSGMLSWHFN